MTIASDEPLIVRDATLDPRFANHPFVVAPPSIRFYASAAVQTRDGHNIGTLCVADHKARKFSARDIDVLSEFAGLVMDELELRALAARDGLTGVLSRRAFKEEATRAVELAERHDSPLSCISLDIDHFKSVNDRFGHAAGDIVLQAVVEACAGTLRRTDRMGRLGGEEFSVLLPKTDLAGALEAAERMRMTIAERLIDLGDSKIAVTASFGIASVGTNVRDVDALLRHADMALYEAKGAGRNRCVAAIADYIPSPSLGFVLVGRH